MKFAFINYFALIFHVRLICVLCTNETTKDSNNLLDVDHQELSPEKITLEAAVIKLTESIVQISTRLSVLESKLDVKFKTLGDALEEEKTAIEILNSRLDNLDSLTVRVNELDSKIDLETSLIRTGMKAINRDRQVLDDGQFDIYGNQTNDPKVASVIGSNEGRINDEEERAAPFQPIDEEELKIGEMVVERIERTLPRLLAAELNHFYLNMASKLDHSVRELQREVTARLRRIEGTTKTALLEIENGRQDISHLSHLQRSANRNITSALHQEITSRNTHVSSCLKEGLDADIKNILLQVNQNLSSSVLQTVTEFHRNLSSREDGQEHSPIKQSDLWGGVFSKGVASSQTSVKLPFSPPKHCVDSSSFDTLQEVKQLLRTLVTKGEDMRRSLSKQTNEGVDLLKLLHQRFSVLLRRMNTDPGHGEALLAEVQELEHLVENSYSSILLAQNVFIESCHRIQQQQPTVEGKILNILNQLVTNIDLGHQLNRKQLQEVRKLIEQIAEEDETKNMSFISSWITSKTLNPSPEKLIGNIPKDRFFSNLVMTVAEANSTEEKLQDVINRISDVEVELQTIGWKSSEFKDTADELLTNAKDLKGYSRDQIEMMQNLQEEILEFVEMYTEFIDAVSSNDIQVGSNDPTADAVAARNASKDNHEGQAFFPEECSLSLLRQFRISLAQESGGSQDNRSNKNGTQTPDLLEKVRLKKEVRNDANLKRLGLTQDHISSTRNGNIGTLDTTAPINKDMLMDQDLDLESHFNSKASKKANKNILEVLHISALKRVDEEPNKITVLEDDFLY